MQLQSLSTRPFIGSKDFVISKAFYQQMGFELRQVGPGLCLCTNQQVAFYLQEAYVRDWVDNTMLFIQVQDVHQCYKDLAALELDQTFEQVRLTPVREESWGSVCFLHDPSGILWQFGTFKQPG